MTRPTILDLDLVVVPREATDEMLEPANFGYSPDKFATLWDAMLSASPYTTAWDDVRKYVEGLERERDEATGTLRYCEKQWSDERGVMIDKFVYERNRAEAAESQLSEIAGHMDSECDSDSILHVVREAEADRNIYKDRAAAAEARIAELEKRLADASVVIGGMIAASDRQPIAGNPEADTNWGLHNDWKGWFKKIFTPAVSAARAYMDGK